MLNKIFHSSLPYLILDGGMGTLLQARGLQAGETPEDWNIEHPNDIASIHRAYVAAGAQILYTNTFGANSLKYHGRHSLEDVVQSGLALAKKVKTECESEQHNIKIALDLGPTGKLLKPAGDLSFDDAVSSFANTIKIATSTNDVDIRPDIIAIETLGDLGELKAAIIAAKENCNLPIYATVTIGQDGKLLTGGSVECIATLLEAFSIDAYGFNCGLGPDRMLPFVERLAKISSKPIIVKPNAGIPSIEDNRTVFSIGPELFAEHVIRLVQAGASIVGGCCGTTPEHISKLKGALQSQKNFELPNQDTKKTIVSSGTSTVELKSHKGIIIGERINPTGKKLLKEAYAKGDTAYVLREAVRQIDAGAAILDINCGVPGLDEAALLDATEQVVQGVVTCPIQIDTADPIALERALRHVNGKPLVNSVNGKRKSMDVVFPLVKKYGGVIVALCLDEQGIPMTSDGRLAIAKRILKEGAKYGFEKQDFVFDALTLAVSSNSEAALITLETVKRLTNELGVHTVLGISNVSFGLPNRGALNNTMYALAKRVGLSAAIANPEVIKDEIDSCAEDVLLGRDKNCAKWIEVNSTQQSPLMKIERQSNSIPLNLCIKRGFKEDARIAATIALSNGKQALELIDSEIVPALEEVGRGFEKGIVYLPQLLMSADAAGEAFTIIRSQLQSTNQEIKSLSKPIVLATVKGDIHDIGKNIVRALLENYGFDVIDLGRDVAPETIVDVARKTNAILVGLSALMTTTVGAMAETIQQLKAAGLSCRTVVGGAVVTQEYADSIGADFYAKDAMRTVRIAESLNKL